MRKNSQKELSLVYPFFLFMGLAFLLLTHLRLQAEPCAVIDLEKSLLIRDTSVVDASDSTDSLSFAHVFAQLTPAFFSTTEHLLAWFDSWESITELNGYVVSTRSTADLRRLFKPSLIAANSPHPLPTQLNETPFLLQAVVYRPDLMTNNQEAGEGRLVYAAIDPKTGDSLNFTVIFEYRLLGDAKIWADEFQSLSRLPFGEKFNQKLSSLVSQFATAKNLNRVRTNDFYLDFVWEMREFQWNEKWGLVPTPTAQTPDLGFNDQQKQNLMAWMQQNQQDILTNSAILPSRFLASTALVFTERFRWLWGEPLPLDQQVRAAFSRQTCNGCHAGETRTGFLHLEPRRRNDISRASAFLLQDLTVRAKYLEALICTKQFERPKFPRRPIH